MPDDASGTAAIEPVPSDPQYDGADNLPEQLRGPHALPEYGLICGVVPRVPVHKRPRARPDNPGPHKPGDAADHVDHAAAREVQQEERCMLAPGHEAVRRPHPVGDGRVDDAGDDQREGHVGAELGALRHGAGDDGGRCGGEGQVEEPRDFVGGQVEREVDGPEGVAVPALQEEGLRLTMSVLARRTTPSQGHHVRERAGHELIVWV